MTTSTNDNLRLTIRATEIASAVFAYGEVEAVVSRHRFVDAVERALRKRYLTRQKLEDELTAWLAQNFVDNPREAVSNGLDDCNLTGRPRRTA